MSDDANGSPANGNPTNGSEPSSPAPDAAGAETRPAGTYEGGARAAEAVKSVVYPRVKSAVSFAKEHPLGTVATVAAAAAFIEVELAVGILAGLGATALLARKTGPETRGEVLARGKVAREQVLARSKSAFTRAKTAWEGRIRPKAKQATEAAAPPS
jgi:hypothetical protein